MDSNERKNVIQHLKHCISVMSGTLTRKNYQQQLNNHRNSLPCENEMKWNGGAYIQVKNINNV